MVSVLRILVPSSLHTDACYVRGACAISANVDRTVDPVPAGVLPNSLPAGSSGPTAQSSSLRPSTRSQSGTIPARMDPATEDPSLWPVGGGGNFVDMTLKVVVKQATGTLFTFDPTFPHGTTRLCGAHNRTITIAFSAHIQEAFERAKMGFYNESGAGAGDGNCPEQE